MARRDVGGRPANLDAAAALQQQHMDAAAALEQMAASAAAAAAAGGGCSSPMVGHPMVIPSTIMEEGGSRGESTC